MSSPVVEPGDPEFAEGEYEELNGPGERETLERLKALEESAARSERKLDRIIKWMEDMEDDFR